jgi:NAD(P)-dependent dehydrogenase (short-subunit alcohol dehydrogenase family)
VTTSDLSATVALVTGAGRGIGRTTAVELATRGAQLALCARTAAQLEDAAEEIEARSGARPVVAVADVTDVHAVESFVERATDALGPPTLLINNAAVLGPVGPLVDVDLGDWMGAVTTNIASIAVLCHVVAPAMSRGGAIVNLSGGGLGGPGLATNVSAYTASKAGVGVLTEALAGELANRKITVNAIAPGAVTTSFMEPVLAAGPARAGRLFDITVAQREQSTPLEPFVELVAYLASSAGRWLTGRILSARWDSVASLESHRAHIEAGSLLQLRRIDDTLYKEVER